MAAAEAQSELNPVYQGRLMLLMTCCYISVHWVVVESPRLALRAARCGLLLGGRHRDHVCARVSLCKCGIAPSSCFSLICAERFGCAILLRRHTHYGALSAGRRPMCECVCAAGRLRRYSSPIRWREVLHHRLRDDGRNADLLISRCMQLIRRRDPSAMLSVGMLVGGIFEQEQNLVVAALYVLCAAPGPLSDDVCVPQPRSSKRRFRGE
jgi:hypothetical protein